MNEEYDWIDEARVIASQCWCDERVEDREMDVMLAEVVAEKIAAWMQTTARSHTNTKYYRGLLEQCGEIIGDRAYITDDGTKLEHVLCSKIPEIIGEDYEAVESVTSRRSNP